MTFNKSTELYMGDIFQDSIAHIDCKRIPNFEITCREIKNIQGIADLLCIPEKSLKPDELEFIKEIDQSLSLSEAKVISLLKKKSNRTIDFLTRNTGYSALRIQTICNKLEARNILASTKGNHYLISSNLPNQVPIWAFELKLKDWKRALFQATQYKSFASYVYTVFPFNMKNVISKNAERFKKLNIGIIFFDPINLDFEILLYSTKNYSRSRLSHVYSLFSLASEFNNKEVCIPF